MLGSSTYGAAAAAALGLPYSFAYHFAPAMLDEALETYRREFRPSAMLGQPHVMLGANVICGESVEHARWLATPGKVAYLGMRQGRPDVYPTPEEAADYRFTALEEQILAEWSRSHVVGDADAVRTELVALVERTGVEELMIGNVVSPLEERVASFERLAELFSLSATR